MHMHMHMHAGGGEWVQACAGCSWAVLLLVPAWEGHCI
jgi:hypothetical protein